MAEKPKTDDDGKTKAVDDFQPRKRLKKQYSTGNKQSGPTDENAVKVFAQQFNVSEILLEDHAPPALASRL